MLIEALTLGLGYNATLVTLGAMALGLAAGGAGTFLFLRKRALVSDAISHATLPGVAAAFLLMVWLGGDGRSLAGLMAGSAVSAALGLLAVHALAARTRLGEDAAIGAVLSVFFGLGVVLLTVVQAVPAGRQAGLESFLLGSTAGMLRSEAMTIAVGGTLALALVALFRRPFTIIAFDEDYARTVGIPVDRLDLVLMALVMAVTVTGLKVVGLILIVALLIIPPVTARFWTDRAGVMVLLSALFGGIAGYVGSAVSATAPALPTGPIIVLVSFGWFVVSLLAAPERGLAASAIRFRRFQREVHLRQGLLAIAEGYPVREAFTRRLLARAGLARADGVPTAAGERAARAALRDEERWRVARSRAEFAGEVEHLPGLKPLDQVLTADQIAMIDRALAGENADGGGQDL